MAIITVQTAALGMDVAKTKLDVVLRLGERAIHQVFVNTAEGFAALDAWLGSFGLTVGQVRVCLEATGSYSDAITLDLFTRGYLLSVLNPAVLVEYRRSQNIRSKTDKLDAHLLARYAQEKQPRLYQPLPTEVLTLRVLLHHRDDVQHMLRQERNRLEAGRMTDAIKERVLHHVGALQAEFKTTEREIKAHLKAHASLKAIWQRLQSIPGIGWLTAARLLAHIGEITRFDKVGSLVSLAGLAIKEYCSGSSVRGKAQIDRHGRKDLRQTMYMSALVAKRVSHPMRAWAQRLQAAGKPKKVIVVAVMRKLLHIVYGVWKSGLDYHPALAFPNAAS
ncbi:MAG TPA: IS110 family transposase [Ktedonobacteraceae bacterium]|nr:IS110 family transposase [Ktedonobacteraceae bacterium]